MNDWIKLEGSETYPKNEQIVVVWGIIEGQSKPDFYIARWIKEINDYEIKNQFWEYQWGEDFSNVFYWSALTKPDEKPM